MKVLIVLCHPIPTSFNAKIAETARDAVEAAGGAFTFHDLYRESFDPVLTEDEFKRDTAWMNRYNDIWMK